MKGKEFILPNGNKVVLLKQSIKNDMQWKIDTYSPAGEWLGEDMIDLKDCPALAKMLGSNHYSIAISRTDSHSIQWFECFTSSPVKALKRAINEWSLNKEWIVDIRSV